MTDDELDEYYDSLRGWFGEPWPSPEERAPVCEDDAYRRETPVGAECMYCEVPVAAGDRGMIVPHLGGERATTVMHVDCMLRAVVPGYEIPSKKSTK